MKKLCLCLLAGIFILTSTGCWDYRSTNDMTIVSGVAVDWNADKTGYEVTYEIIDPNIPVQDNGIMGQILVSEGETLFDAARNAKRELKRKLYFGNVSLLVISHEIAEEGINPVLDWFYRDANPRETMYISICKNAKASDFMAMTEKEENILSYDISFILSQDHKQVLSTSNYQLYQLFSFIREEGQELTLPLFESINEEEMEKTISGVAVFHSDKLTGYLNADDTRYYLFATDQVQGGLINVPINSAVYTYEVFQNKTRLSYEKKDGNYHFKISTDTLVSLGENPRAGIIRQDEAAFYEAAIAEHLETKIEGIVKKVQQETGSDIFCFGDCIYRNDPSEWEKIAERWYSELFQQVTVEVESKVTVMNYGLMQ